MTIIMLAGMAMVVIAAVNNEIISKKLEDQRHILDNTMDSMLTIIRAQNIIVNAIQEWTDKSTIHINSNSEDLKNIDQLMKELHFYMCKEPVQVSGFINPLEDDVTEEDHKSLMEFIEQYNRCDEEEIS